MQTGSKAKSREGKRKPATKLKHVGFRPDSLERSGLVGSHTKSFFEHRGFGGSLLAVPRAESRDREQRTLELRRLLQRKPREEERRPSRQQSKATRHLTSITQTNLTDAQPRSASKDLLAKVKTLFANRSTEKPKLKPKKSRDKKVLKTGDDGGLPLRAGSQGSREASRVSRGSRESTGSREKSQAAVQQLARFYDKLCNVVDDRADSHDDKIAAIARLFVDYGRLLDSLDADARRHLGSEERRLRNKILGFFSFYCKMNTKAYLYTRRLVADSLAHVEQFVAKQRDAISQFAPHKYDGMESVDMEDAVKLVVDFANTMVEQNALLSAYIRKNLKKTEADELLLRKNKPAILKSLLPSKAFDSLRRSDSSLSNLEKENDLNQLYELSAVNNTGLEMEAAAHLVKTYGKKYEEADQSKTPVTSKLGYYNNPEADLCESNDYEYSETSKKKTITALGRKNSRVLEASLHEKHESSKGKKRVQRNSRERLDDASSADLHDRQAKAKQPPAADLRLKLGQLKMS